MIIFGTHICPDCVEAEKRLKEAGIPYVYREITESTGIMKQFLRLRDKRAEFDEVKEKGSIGVPCFVMEDGRILFELEEILKMKK